MQEFVRRLSPKAILVCTAHFARIALQRGVADEAYGRIRSGLQFAEEFAARGKAAEVREVAVLLDAAAARLEHDDPTGATALVERIWRENPKLSAEFFKGIDAVVSSRH